MSRTKRWRGNLQGSIGGRVASRRRGGRAVAAKATELESSPPVLPLISDEASYGNGHDHEISNHTLDTFWCCAHRQLVIPGQSCQRACESDAWQKLDHVRLDPPYHQHPVLLDRPSPAKTLRQLFSHAFIASGKLKNMLGLCPDQDSIFDAVDQEVSVRQVRTSWFQDLRCFLHEKYSKQDDYIRNACHVLRIFVEENIIINLMSSYGPQQRTSMVLPMLLGMQADNVPQIGIEAFKRLQKVIEEIEQGLHDLGQSFRADVEIYFCGTDMRTKIQWPQQTHASLLGYSTYNLDISNDLSMQASTQDFEANSEFDVQNTDNINSTSWISKKFNDLRVTVNPGLSIDDTSTLDDGNIKQKTSGTDLIDISQSKSLTIPSMGGSGHVPNSVHQNGATQSKANTENSYYVQEGPAELENLDMQCLESLSNDLFIIDSTPTLVLTEPGVYQTTSVAVPEIVSPKMRETIPQGHVSCGETIPSTGQAATIQVTAQHSRCNDTIWSDSAYHVASPYSINTNNDISLDEASEGQTSRYKFSIATNVYMQKISQYKEEQFDVNKVVQFENTVNEMKEDMKKRRAAETLTPNDSSLEVSEVSTFGEDFIKFEPAEPGEPRVRTDRQIRQLMRSRKYQARKAQRRALESIRNSKVIPQSDPESDGWSHVPEYKLQSFQQQTGEQQRSSLKRKANETDLISEAEHSSEDVQDTSRFTGDESTANHRSARKPRKKAKRSTTAKPSQQDDTEQTQAQIDAQLISEAYQQHLRCTTEQHHNDKHKSTFPQRHSDLEPDVLREASSCTVM